MAMALEKFRSMLTQRSGDWRKAGVDPNQFIAMATTYAIKEPTLLDWDPKSVFLALRECAELGLMPHGIVPGVYLTPFKGKCVPIVHYRALAALARQSGAVRDLIAEPVYENDRFERGVRTDGVHFLHEPPAGNDDRGELRGCYCVGWDAHGKIIAPTWMTTDELDTHGRKFGGPVWKSHPMPMRLKTVTRRFVERLPLRPEHAKLVRAATLGDEPPAHDVGVKDADFLDVTGDAPTGGVEALKGDLSGKAKSAAMPAPEPEHADAALRTAYNAGAQAADDPTATCPYDDATHVSAWGFGRTGDEFDVEAIRQDAAPATTKGGAK